MAFNSISTLQKNRVYAPVITGLAILLAVLVARPAFTAYSEAKMELFATETTLSEQQSKLSKLEEESAKLADENSELSKNVAKITREFTPSEIFEVLLLDNKFTVASAVSGQTTPSVSVTDVVAQAGNKEPSGIYRGTVNLKVSAKNPEMIAAYLDFLTSHPKFAFTLNDISLPINTQNPQTAATETTVDVTLGLYYYP